MSEPSGSASNPKEEKGAPQPATALGASKSTSLPGSSKSVSASATSSPARSQAGKPGAPLDEGNIERLAVRHGLVTQTEVEACKGLRSKNPDKNLLELMVGAGVLTKGQATRLLREMGEAPGKLEIPGYQILERLGKGSMGMVYKARQTSVDRIVAVKVLLDSLSQDREFIDRFQREAKIAAKLQHNNIVNAIDAGSVGKLQFFVMEFVEGKTIKDVIDAGKIFDEREALEIILSIADALKHAHQRGLIHRDIKPENIMLPKDGGAKLADLGLARPTSDEKWASAEAGLAIGTPYYISPEQVRGQVDVDVRADIYCLGGTLYHMVTGRVPYPGTTPNDVMKKHADEKCLLTPPDHLNTRLSSGLGEVVETMMAKNRENRYGSPDDLILDLRCLIAGDRPRIAAQKADALSSLSESADEAEAVEMASSVTEEEKQEMAALVNSKTTIITVLGVLLGVSALTNLLMLLAR